MSVYATGLVKAVPLCLSIVLGSLFASVHAFTHSLLYSYVSKMFQLLLSFDIKKPFCCRYCLYDSVKGHRSVYPVFLLLLSYDNDVTSTVRWIDVMEKEKRVSFRLLLRLYYIWEREDLPFNGPTGCPTKEGDQGSFLKKIFSLAIVLVLRGS